MAIVVEEAFVEFVVVEVVVDVSLVVGITSIVVVFVDGVLVGIVVVVFFDVVVVVLFVVVTWSKHWHKEQ